MPEGPQMVFLKEQASHLIGQEVVEAKGSAKDIPFQKIKGQRLVDIKTFGKEILFCFPSFTVRFHLMLFGKCAIDSQLPRVLTVGFEFDNGEINFYASKPIFIEEPLDKVYDWSTDVLNAAFDVNKAVKGLMTIPTHQICEALLDQDILAGVGNKIKNEALFRRQVHPESVVGEIPEKILKSLVKDCVKLSHEYLEWKREGVEDAHWKVYKKVECVRDHIPLQKAKIGKSKRSCYFCDRCQHLYLANN